MTQEEKAKAYDEALERARKIHNETEFDYEKGMMEEVFPELVVSEDEKIRKALITFFQKFPYCSMEKAGTNAIDAITWLEKQSKQKQPIWTDNDRTMTFTLLRDVDQMTYISNEGKNERFEWLNSLEDKFNNKE